MRVRKRGMAGDVGAAAASLAMPTVLMWRGGAGLSGGAGISIGLLRLPEPRLKLRRSGLYLNCHQILNVDQIRIDGSEGDP